MAITAMQPRARAPETGENVDADRVSLRALRRELTQSQRDAEKMAARLERMLASLSNDSKHQYPTPDPCTGTGAENGGGVSNRAGA